MDKKLIDKQKYSDFNSEILPHINLLKNHALVLTKNPDDADDLLQDTMLKAFRFYHNFERGTNAKAWLFKIMQNSFINNYRDKIRQPVKIDYDDVKNFYENIKSEDVKIQHYQQDAFSNVLDDDITKALSVLPDDFRTIVFLCDIEGYSYKEISDFLDCPIGTVRSRLHRTRKILFALLYKYAEENGYLRSERNKDFKNHERKMIVISTVSENVPIIQ